MENIFQDTTLVDVRDDAITRAQRLVKDQDLRWLTIDIGWSVAVGFPPGRLYETFAPSLAHLVVDPTVDDADVPDLTIVVADSAHLGQHPVIRSDTEGFPRTAAYVVDDLDAVNLEPHASISALNWERRFGVWWLDEIGGLSSWQVSAPLRQLFAWWAPRTGQVLAHAAVVGDGTRGVMITAAGGAGKSTTTMQCGLDGLQVLSDDYCVIQPGDSTTARAATRCCKLSDDSLNLLGTHFGKLDNSHQLSSDEKNLIYLPLDGPNPAATCLELAAVVVPRIGTDEKATLGPALGSAALSSLAMSSIFQFNADPAPVLKACREIIEGLPTFELILGSDLSSSTERISELLAGRIGHQT